VCASARDFQLESAVFLPAHDCILLSARIHYADAKSFALLRFDDLLDMLNPRVVWGKDNCKFAGAVVLNLPRVENEPVETSAV
jgi:hypothetical protein